MPSGESRQKGRGESSTIPAVGLCMEEREWITSNCVYLERSVALSKNRGRRHYRASLVGDPVWTDRFERAGVDGPGRTGPACKLRLWKCARYF